MPSESRTRASAMSEALLIVLATFMGVIAHYGADPHWNPVRPPLVEIDEKTGRAQVCLFVPTTPNPTSGFFLMMPRADVIELKMSVDDALKYVISMGVVVPGGPAALQAKASLPPPP